MSQAMQTIETLEEALQTWRRFSRDYWTPDNGGEAVDAGEVPRKRMIDLRIEQNAHAKILRLLEGCAPGRILEVGCAGGEVGAQAKAWGHKVWGIEMSPRSAAAARQKLDQVYLGSIAGFLADHPDERFDHLLFGDELTHLPAPVKTLVACARLIKPGGAVIGFVPNIAHRSVRMMLLDGRFGYEQEGIMAQTHLRFYTRDTVVDLLTSAGFAIDFFDEVIADVALPSEAHDHRMADCLSNAVLPLLRDSALDVFQYVFRARPRPAPTRPALNVRYRRDQGPRLLCLLPVPESSLASIRIEQPLLAWRRRHGGEFRIRKVTELNQLDNDWCSHVLMQRESNPIEFRMIRSFQVQGKLVLFDLDDLLTEIPPHLIAYSATRWKLPWLRTTLSQVDAVTTSTKPLQQAMKEYNRRTYLVPNGATSLFEPIQHHSRGAVTSAGGRKRYHSDGLHGCCASATAGVVQSQVASDRCRTSGGCI